ncbi:MAG: efflux RND transporter periplasmic adaptor subunit [Thermoanaerobaculia bacterium]
MSSDTNRALEELRIDRGADEERPSRAWLALVVGVVLVAAVVLGWWLRSPAVAEVRTAVAREIAGGAQSTVLNASGYVTARRQATVSSKVTGRVMAVLIEEGMEVDEGQVLARLDDSNVRVNVRLAEAQRDAARSTLLETEVRLAEAELELERTQSLVRTGIASQAALDRAQAEVDSLEARLERQRDDAAVAERQVALWMQQLEDTVIRSPFAGVIVTKNAQPGEMISPISAGGGFTRTGIGTVVDMGSLEIEVDVNEAYINRVAPSQRVEATLDSYPDWKIPCRVIAIIPTADRQRATVKVRIGFEKLDPRILPDMGVKVAFQAEEASARLGGVVVPRRAVRQNEGHEVGFVVEEGRAERRAVKVSEGMGEEAIIVSGLAAGERVVVDGPDDLADGDAVEEVRG